MRPLVIAGLCALAGCDVVYGLDRPQAELVAYFTMDGESGLVDASGYNHATQCLGNCAREVPGVFGTALELDGATIVQVTSSLNLETTTGFTVSGWYDQSELPTFGCPFSKAVGDEGENSWQLCFNVLREPIFYGGSTESVAAAVSPDWVHVVLWWDGATKKIFVSGVQVKMDADATLAFDAGRAGIGGDFDGGMPAAHYVGAIDELRVYGVPLTDEDIVELSRRP